MPREHPFVEHQLRRIRAGEVGRVLVLADWLEERGDPRVPALREAVAVRLRHIEHWKARDWTGAGPWSGGACGTRSWSCSAAGGRT